jgi:plasmid stabilization system protein ParE
MKYRLTDAAKRDVREITNHIRVVQKSPQNARLVATRLKKMFARLVEIPQLGHAPLDCKPFINPAEIRNKPTGGRDYDPASRPE